jgi:crossover junction endodeoxyribonuclease RuvC
LDAAAASTRPGRRAARNDRQPASAERADTGKEPAGAAEGGGTHETIAGSRRANRTRQAERPTMTILGVDIGAGGALAALSDAGELIDVWDMPTLRDGPAKRRTINAPLLAEIVYKSHATRAFVERVGPRPLEGAVGAFAFGDAKGVVRGCLAAAAIPTIFITPVTWKRAVGVPPGKDMKDMARSNAINRWPGQAQLFARKMDDGRAEAALIGLAGLLRFNDVVELMPVDLLKARAAKG